MSPPRRLKAAFYRGGTSKAVVFDGRDLPADRDIRDRIFLHVLGSPDANGRQLDGMGGGLSSLSKVVIVEPSARDDADVDYTFVQIAVAEAVADYGAACGNMSSCVGPFAVEEGMIDTADGEAVVRIYNTNTRQIYVARFKVLDGLPVEQGDFSIPGVSGTAAPVALDMLDPGGSACGALMPTGHAVDVLDVPGIGPIEATMVDAANPVVFVRAIDLGHRATGRPADLDGDTGLMMRLDMIRRAGAVAMGLAKSTASAGLANPKVAMIDDPAPFTALDGQQFDTGDHDIAIRMVSMGNIHRAVTLTGGICLAVAAQIPGSLPQQISTANGGSIRIGNPSGVLPVTARLEERGAKPHAVSATTYRTQRRIMEGAVLYPADLVGQG